MKHFNGSINNSVIFIEILLEKVPVFEMLIWNTKTVIQPLNFMHEEDQIRITAYRIFKLNSLYMGFLSTRYLNKGVYKQAYWNINLG